MCKTNIKHKILIIAFIIALTSILISIILIGGDIMRKYSTANLLCEQIKSGEPIDTEFANGSTVPLWFDKIATVLQIEGPKIPLIEACYYKNVQAVSVLLENGADPNKCIPGRFSALESAILSRPIDERSFEIVKLLVNYGVDINMYSSYSPVVITLSEYITAGNDDLAVQDILFYLIEQGANCQYKGYNTVGFNIVRSGNLGIINRYFDLCENDTNDLGIGGRTMLIEAVIYSENTCKPEVIALLLKNGADKTIKDNEGKTAYDYAVEQNKSDIIALLEN